MQNNPVDTAAKIFEPLQRRMRTWTDLYGSITAPLKKLTDAYSQLEVAMCMPTLNIEPLPTIDIQLLPSRPRWPKRARRRSRRLARRLAHRIGAQQMN